MLKNIIYSFYLTLLFPLFGVFTGLRIRNFHFQRAILTLGITVFGSTIVLSEGTDGFEHKQNVYDHYLDLTFTQFWQELVAILSFTPLPGTNDDVYIHLLSYFLGGILGMPQLFFVFVAFVYGYFFSGSMLKILKAVPATKLSYLFYVFAVLFVLYKNVEGINTVRTWTGLWILFYASISYFETKKKRYLILMLIPPLIHVGYFVMSVPTWIIAIFGSRFKSIYIGVFIISIFYGVNQNYIIDTLSKTTLGENKTRAYYVEDIEEWEGSRIKETQTWYLKLMKEGLNKYPQYLIIFTLLIGGAYFKGMSNLESSLFSIGLLTKSLSNFSGFLFALSQRSSLIGSIFILAALVLLLKRNYFVKRNHQMTILYYGIFIISALLYFPFVVFKIADLIYYTSVFMVALPFVPWIYNEANLSIREFIGKFI